MADLSSLEGHRAPVAGAGVAHTPTGQRFGDGAGRRRGAARPLA